MSAPPVKQAHCSEVIISSTQRRFILYFRCFAAAEEDVNRAVELSKDKNDPALQRLLKSITKARGKLAVATADYMSPSIPLGGSSGALVGNVPLYYSLDVSGVGGGGLGAGTMGMGSGGEVIAGHVQSHVERWNDQQQHNAHQHSIHHQQQQSASPQVSQEFLGGSAAFGVESAFGAAAGSGSSRSSEILQVRIAHNSSASGTSTHHHVLARFCVHLHYTENPGQGALSPLPAQLIKVACMLEAAGQDCVCVRKSRCSA